MAKAKRNTRDDERYGTTLGREASSLESAYAATPGAMRGVTGMGHGVAKFNVQAPTSRLEALQMAAQASGRPGGSTTAADVVLGPGTLTPGGTTGARSRPGSVPMPSGAAQGAVRPTRGKA